VGNFTVPSSTKGGVAVWRKVNIAEGAGNIAGHKRQRYQTALGSAREVLACIQVAQAMRYIGTVDARVLDRMDHVIATLGRLVYRRASWPRQAGRPSPDGPPNGLDRRTHNDPPLAIRSGSWFSRDEPIYLVCR